LARLTALAVSRTGWIPATHFPVFPVSCFFLSLTICIASAQTNDPPKHPLTHLDSKLTRQLNELLWFQRLNDLAIVDTLHFAGPPPRATNGLAPPAGSNDVLISALTFLPRQRSHLRKLPLIVFAHGEIHGNVATDEPPLIVRELLQQGYAVVAPDYRGSSGYGSEFWRQIDYGGLEIEDVDASRKCMLERHHEVDPKRVGIIGWSHGGAIALLTVIAHPDDYRACYAGVPVSDLEERIRIRGKDYEQLFAAAYHLGKTITEAPEEYRRRSPAANVEKLRTPLLIQANTSDNDVTLREIEHLTHALQAAGKDFTFHVYTNAPGSHFFNRLDTQAAQDSRAEIWHFLARYLHPPRNHE
jgi:dipeptidyl aminopeptidase/acylaminoacyl peptidase